MRSNNREREIPIPLSGFSPELQGCVNTLVSIDSSRRRSMRADGITAPESHHNFNIGSTRIVLAINQTKGGKPIANIKIENNGAFVGLDLSR